MLETRRRRQFNVFPFAADSSLPDWSHRPLISVVLPVYNHGSFVAEAIESVIHPSRYRVELIIVNDGSTDCTAEVLKTFEDRAEVTIIAQENRGLPEALNRGFAEARGSLLTWTSADNRYLPGTLDRLADFLIANPEIGLVYGNVRLIDENGEAFRDSSYRSQDQSAADSSVLLLPLSAETLDEINDNFINACVLFRGDLARFAGPLRAEHLGFEDYVQWLRLTRFASAVHIDTDEPLYHYRLHRNSLTANLSTKTLQRGQGEHVEDNRLVRRQLKSALDFKVSVGRGNSTGTMELVTEALTQAGYAVRGNRSLLRGGFEIVRQGERGAISLSGTASTPPSFAHKPHARFTAECGPLSLKPAHLDELLLLPPLKIPPALTRARDTSFGAVSPESSSKCSLLYFPPEDSDDPAAQRRDEFLAFLVNELKEVTFAFFCETEAERQWADRFCLGNQQAKNLRIIDITEQKPEQSVLSMMYVLSSVDAILHYSTADIGPYETAEIRVEAGLAAAAGIPLLALGSLALGDLERWFIPIPHLALLNAAKPDVSLLAEFRKLLPGLMEGVDQNSQEQWLRRNSYCSFGRTLAALTFP